MKRYWILLLISLVLFALPSVAEQSDATGRVTLPLNEYATLVERARDPEERPRSAPAEYALGEAGVSVRVNDVGARASADVTVNLAIKVFESKWVLVPILPPGTPVSSARIGGKSVELVSGRDGLGWGVKDAGSYSMQLSYRVDAERSENGYALPLPLPRASAINLSASLPGTGLDATIIPSAGSKTTSTNGRTTITATIPATSGVQLSWRVPRAEGHTISRASYTGTLKGEAVSWKGEYRVELFNDETVTLKLLPESVTLTDIQIDGKSSSIVVSEGRFSTLVKGRGEHAVTVLFQVPVQRTNGPPRINLQIPQIPVSRFDFTLPGKKEITATPSSNVTYKEAGDKTVATLHVPMTEKVSLAWSEAVPAEVKAEVRANAGLYHLIHAEEGVLYVRAIASYEITRGETNVIELEIPEGVQVNRITDSGGAIADWRVVKNEKGDLASIFLDRKVTGRFDFTIEYDRSLVGSETTKDILVPLLRARDVHRQRGMVALLASKELTLKPVKEERVTRVGENQLPAFVRQVVEKTVAHTYKYVEQTPGLLVQATEPERKRGKFDAQINTLISVGDVTMTGSATVEVNVKSGKIEDLQLELPVGVNFLGLTAPSLRTHKLNVEGDRQLIDVQFTQEMEGQFRIEVTYERIMSDKEADAGVPTLLVRGAEVEQGRIAIEALSAVEVKPSRTDQLSLLDPNELPQQLILKTTDPILLAYKYVHVDPPYTLALKITRHKEIEVQSATIDRAQYHTLFTEDGLAVTTAQYNVRNSRKQFLRVQLPPESKIWSAFVDGKPEKPALAGEGGEKGAGPSVLIKIINSVHGFPVSITYQTPVNEMGSFGVTGSSLPRPDMVVTHSRWSVYLPDELSYGRPTTNMKVIEEGTYVTRDRIHAEVAAMTPASKQTQSIDPLRITVPAAGIRYVFEKLYANQAEENAQFTIPYASGAGKGVTVGLISAGTLLVWLGLFALAGRGGKLSSSQAASSIVLGGAILGVAIGYYGSNPNPAFILSGLVLLAAIGVMLREKLPRRSQNEV